MAVPICDTHTHLSCQSTDSAVNNKSLRQTAQIEQVLIPGAFWPFSVKTIDNKQQLHILVYVAAFRWNDKISNMSLLHPCISLVNV